MLDYRLYCLDGDGRFIHEHDIHAVNDAQALQESRRMKLPYRCELWQRGRMVAKLDPTAGGEPPPSADAPLPPPQRPA